MDILLSTAYLPSISYFSYLVSSETLFVEQHENYAKQTYRNRCYILTANGIMPLVIPTERKHGEKIKIRDVRIDYSTGWQTSHWRAMIAAYRSSPFFEYYIEDFLPFYTQRESFLFDLNLKLLEKTVELSGIEKKIILTEKYMPVVDDNIEDRRNISPKTTKNKEFKPYCQVFGKKFGFSSDLSIFDLLCNEGNNALSILMK